VFHIQTKLGMKDSITITCLFHGVDQGVDTTHEEIDESVYEIKEILVSSMMQIFHLETRLYFQILVPIHQKCSFSFSSYLVSKVNIIES